MDLKNRLGLSDDLLETALNILKKGQANHEQVTESDQENLKEFAPALAPVVAPAAAAAGRAAISGAGRLARAYAARQAARQITRRTNQSDLDVTVTAPAPATTTPRSLNPGAPPRPVEVPPPTPARVPTPGSPPKPAEVPTPSAPPAPSAPPRPTEVPRPALPPAPARVPAPSSPPKPSAPPKPAEVPAPSSPPKPSAPPKPPEVPKPNYPPKPSEAPTPSTPPKPSEAPTPSAPPKPSEVPAPSTPSIPKPSIPVPTRVPTPTAEPAAEPASEPDTKPRAATRVAPQAATQTAAAPKPDTATAAPARPSADSPTRPAATPTPTPASTPRPAPSTSSSSQDKEGDADRLNAISLAHAQRRTGPEAGRVSFPDSATPSQDAARAQASVYDKESGGNYYRTAADNMQNRRRRNAGGTLDTQQESTNVESEMTEGKKISHPNQRVISAAAPPEDEITAADFKALKAKKKHRVEGYDRNRKRYESPLFETYEDALAFFTKLRKSSPLTNLEIVQIDELSKPVVANYMTKVAGQSPEKQKPSRDSGMELASKKLNKPGAVRVPAAEEFVDEAKELNTANANDARAHDCAKHVVHEQWGIGETVPTMHADPDVNGNIAWYDIMFEHGIELEVPTAELDIILSETHVHKKSKRMSEASEVGGKKIENLKTKKLPNGTLNPEQAKEEVEHVEEKTLTSAEMRKREEVAKAIKREHPNMPMGMKMAIATKVAKKVAEETDILDEGRKAGVVGSVLSNPAAREHFKKLTGKEPSYFHISKNPEHAQAALTHAAKAKAPEGEKPAEAGDDDTEANKHPVNQLRGIVDRGKGKFMGKDITRAHANKLLSMHDELKPSQRLDFVSNIGKHLSKVMS